MCVLVLLFFFSFFFFQKCSYDKVSALALFHVTLPVDRAFAASTRSCALQLCCFAGTFFRFSQQAARKFGVDGKEEKKEGEVLSLLSLACEG